MTDLFVQDAEYLYLWPYFVVLGGVAWLGGGLSTLGLLGLQKREAVFKAPFKLTAISWMIFWALEVKVIQCWYVNAADGGMQLAVLELMALAASAVTVFAMFRSCLLIAKQCKDRRFHRKLRWKSIVYLILVILYVLLLSSGIFWEIMILYSWALWPGVNIFAAWAWIQVYRRFNGKEPREE